MPYNCVSSTRAFNQSMKKLGNISVIDNPVFIDLGFRNSKYNQTCA